MPAIYRAPADYFFGTLSTAAAVSDTTINSATFANLPGGTYTTTFVLPLILHNPALGTHEVVWVTGHTAGSSQATVVRAKEGSTAQAWPSGTQIICAPTAARDGLAVGNSTGLPTDGHVGMRLLEADTGVVVQQTYGAGWQPDCGVANPLDFGLARGGGAVPGTANLVMRGGLVTATTNSSGQITVPFKAPFPTACICGVVTPSSSQLGPFQVVSEAATGLTVQVWTMTSFTTATPAASGISVSLSYLAVGY